ncbi:MAG: LbtU family siderophore porin [Desulfosarcina sp.]
MKTKPICFMVVFLYALCLLLIALPLCAQETAPASEDAVPQKAGGVKGLEDRLNRLEQAIGREVQSDKWYDRIQISGLIEVEAIYLDFVDKQDPTADTKESDVELATVELVVDAKIAKHVDGHVMFKYEADEVFVDEGFVTLVGTETFPAYLIAGRQYVPFGYYESFFVTDPTTLVLGETNQDAAVAGYRFGGEMFDIAVGAFNGEIDKAGDDDVIDSFVAALTASFMDGKLMAGASYTSNLASSDTFSVVIEDNGTTELTDLVGAWSAFVTVDFLERFQLIGEYVGALDDFEAGEIFDPALDKKRKPTAWNVEFGALILEDLGLSVRYGGSDDGGDFLPEKQYGAVLNWGIWQCNLALEYLHDEFDDTDLAVDQEADTFTVQLAVEF